MNKRITIAQRQRPFSHTPGTKVLLPGSNLIVTVYPCMLDHFPIKLTGPVKDFTVMLDLERGFVKVWGHYKEGFLRYRIHATLNGGYSIITEKSPIPGLLPTCDDPIYEAPPLERLFLGCNKSQDWDMVKRRMDPAEILPFWHRIGQMVPDDTTEISSLMNAFRAHFDGIMAPRAEDTDHQGLELTPHAQALPSQGYKDIRAQFLQQDGNHITLHRSEFPAGRLINVSCGQLGTLDIELTKRSLRSVVLHSPNPEMADFTFPHNKFRMTKLENCHLFDRFGE